jgi:hypothetical protein
MACTDIKIYPKGTKPPIGYLNDNTGLFYKDNKPYKWIDIFIKPDCPNWYSYAGWHPDYIMRKRKAI